MGRGMSYSVMMARVARPVGRGKVLERVFPLRHLAQIDLGEVFALLLELLGSARAFRIERARLSAG